MPIGATPTFVAEDSSSGYNRLVALSVPDTALVPGIQLGDFIYRHNPQKINIAIVSGLAGES